MTGQANEEQREDEDGLAEDAAAYDASLHEKGKTPSDFSKQHGSLAAVFRMLNNAFDLSVDTVGGGQAGAAHQTDLPAHFSRFRFVSELGRGAFGVVYRAFDEVLHRDVAIKVIPGSESAGGASGDDRFLEARAAARLSHAHVVPIYEVHQEGQAVYLVSEFCDGPTLADWLRDNPGPLQPQMAADIVLRLTDAAAHAHARGLVHRDIKPGNVLLVPSEERNTRLPFSPRLTDFGLVHDLRVVAPETVKLAGTYAYMAPEQILGGPAEVSAAVDVYALGVLFYRLLTGRLPHAGESTLELLKGVCTLPPVKPRELVASIPRDLEAICLKCLNKLASGRYDSARQMADDIVRWKLGQSVLARSQPFWERGWRTVRASPIEAALIASMCVVAMSAALVLMQLNKQLGRQSDILRDALITSQASEQLAIASKLTAVEALEDARQQRIRAEKSQRLATWAAYRADIVRGFEAIRHGRPAEAWNITQDIESYVKAPEAVGIDFKLLRAIAAQNSVGLSGHDGPIHEVMVIPGQTLAISAGEDGVIRFHDTRDGRHVRSESLGGSSRIHALACSPDGSQLAVGIAVPGETSTANSVAIVDWQEWEVQQFLEEFPTTVDSIAFSPDGTRLAVGCRYEPVTIHSLSGEQGSISLWSERRNEQCFFSPDGQQVLVHAKDAQLRLYDSRSGTVAQEYNSQIGFRHLAWSANGRWIAANGLYDPKVILLDPKNISIPRAVLSQPHGGTNCLAFSAEGDHLVAGLFNGGIVSWNLTAIDVDSPASVPPPILSFQKYVAPLNAPVSGIAYIDNDRVICGSEDGTVVLASLARSSHRDQLDSLATQSAQLMTDGESVYLGCADGSLVKYEFETERVTQQLAPLDREMIGTELLEIALSSDSAYLGLMWRYGGNGLLHLPSGDVFHSTHTLAATKQRLLFEMTACFDANSNRLLSFRSPDRYHIWHYPSTHPGGIPEQGSMSMARFKAVTGAKTMCFIPSKDIIVAGGDTEHVAQLSVSDGSERVLLSNCGRVSALLYDPVRQQIFSGHLGGMLQKHSMEGDLLATGSHTAVPFLPSTFWLTVTCLALSPDGRNLISGSSDGELRIWHADDMYCLGVIHESNGLGWISDIGFSQDGRRLMFHQRLDTGAVGQRLHIIDIPY